MYRSFPPTKKNGLFSKKSANSLVIDNNVLEYSFIRRRGKSRVEMKIDLYSAKNLLKSVQTLVKVRVDLADLVYAKYNEATKEMIIVGKFMVTYQSIASGQEIVRNYDDESCCFCFIYDFEDIDRFLEILREKMKCSSCHVPLMPISL